MRDWDNRPEQPVVFIGDELTASGTFTLLLLPKLFGEAAVLQPLQHSRALSHREIVIPNRIEWVGVRLNFDVTDDPSV